MKIQCPAKINLFLEITGKRKDGYHNVATLMAKTNLYDVIDIDWAPGNDVVFSVNPDGGAIQIPQGPDNLAVKAATSLRREFNVRRGIRIVLTKNIPVGAGLGGGSSDAAGTLLGLAKLLDLPQSAKTKKALIAIGRALGADVPFFLHPKSFALGRGIGDRLKTIPVAGVLPYLILAYPEVSISTAESYKALPKIRRSDVLTRISQLDRLAQRLKRGRPIQEWGSLLFNRMEESGLEALKTVSQARSILERLGLLGVRMSGSGSAVFGFAESYEEGRTALSRLAGYPWKTYLTSLSG
ncbi:MAG: 4-(cytidine 5'-diphospho)-2-C-methyl-D-erythritol kinase [Elusimicrobiota bacterium]